MHLEMYFNTYIYSASEKKSMKQYAKSKNIDFSRNLTFYFFDHQKNHY